jgi:type IV fimbrial biogenesis protein FimT
MTQTAPELFRGRFTHDPIDGRQLPPGGAAIRGFTLVEAMVVMAIIAILMAIAVPSFRDFTASRAISAQLSDFAGSLRLARTEAIKRGRPVVMCRSSDPHAAVPACSSSGNDWKSGWLVMQGDTLIRVQSSYVNSGGIVASDGINTITFRATGIAPATSEAEFTFKPLLPAGASSYAALTRKVCLGVTGVTRSC